MIRSATVVRCNATSAEIKLDALSSCGSCSTGGCTAMILPDLNPRITVPTSRQLTVGDRLQIQVAEPDSAWLRLMAVAYGLPLAGLFAGVLGALVSGLSESMSVVVGALGFVGGLIAWHLVGKTNWWNAQLAPPLSVIDMSSIHIVDSVYEQPLIGPVR